MGSAIVAASLVGMVVLLVGLAGRANLAAAQRRACHEAIADRVTSIQVRTVQARSARAIGSDPFQSARIRRIRLWEARALEKSVRNLRLRVDPAHGGRLICARAFPNPDIL